MNKQVILVAESGADITKEQAEKYGIYIVPMHVSMGDKTLDDGSFPVDEICAFYDRTGKLPKTSGSSPEDFRLAFDTIHEKWPEKHILYLAYSAATTVSFASANIVAEGRDYIRMIDTKFVAAAQGAIVLETEKMMEENPDAGIDEVEKYAQGLCNRARMCFLPDDLEYLKAGGRVSNFVCISGRLLKLHPRIELLEGKLMATKKHRGSLLKVAPQLVRDYSEENNLDKEQLWLIWAIGISKEVMDAAEKTAYECGFKKVTWVQTGCVITTHGGPGAFGVVGFTAEK